MRTSGKRPSLFAFQDIITSVIGIFVFISILLAISISIEVANEIVDINAINDVNAAAKIAHNKDKISSLKKLIQTIEQRRELEKINQSRVESVQNNSKILAAEIEKLEEILRINPDSSAIEKLLEERRKRLKDEAISQRVIRNRMESDIEALKEDLERIKEDIEKYKDALIIHSGTGETGGKTPIHILCRGNTFCYLATGELVEFKELQHRMLSIPKDSFYMQFFFTPSGTIRYFELNEFCSKNKIQFGAMAILEGEKIIYEK